MKRLLLYCTMLLLTIPAISQTLPAGFTTTTIGSGWNAPVGAVFTPDGLQLYVWEQGGRVYVCKRDGSGNYIKQNQVVLDISEEVGNWRDHGLLGFALDPNFSVNGYIYLLYVVDRHHLMNFGTASYNPATNTYSSATIGRVTRYQTIVSGTDRVAVPGSRAVLLGETRSTGVPILYESHSVGGLAFASDGTLLVSTGDGASYSTTDPGNIGHTYYATALTDGIITPEENVGAFRSQLLNSLSGKLLRIDPATGDGVSSNPFYNPAAPRAPQSRVWALGFRNPFRIAVIPGTGSTNPSAGDIGEVIVGDVGWNTWEEINIIRQPGENCGWPLFEGQLIHTSYNNGSLNTANAQEPNPLNGIGGCTLPNFRFKDLLKQATADGITTIYNPCNAAVPIGSSNRFFHRRPAIAWRHGSNSTQVPKFNGNNATNPEIGTAASGVTGTPFQGNCVIAGTWYNGNNFPSQYKNTIFSADLGGRWLKSIAIDFTDVVTRVENFGSNFTNLVSVAQNPLDGSLVTVEISGTGVKRIAYGGNQMPEAKLQSNVKFGPGPLQVNFTGSLSTDPDGSIVSYAWDFGNGNTSTTANPSFTFTPPTSAPTKYVVKLTVTDNQGGTDTDSLIISVNNTPPVVNITSPVKNSTYTANGNDITYSCTATVTDAEQEDGKLKYAWQSFLCHNNHRHADPIDTSRVTTTTIAAVGCNDDEYYWLVELTVTDEAGLSTKDSTKIFPDCLTTLTGSIGLQSGAPKPHANWVVPVTVDLYLTGTNTSAPTFTHNAVTDQNGDFVITGIPPGTYTITVKNPKTLKKVLGNQKIILGNNPINFGLMLAGDANNSNSISGVDLSILVSCFGTSLGNPAFDGRADFNRDNVISGVDLSLILSNFGLLGENP